MRGAHQQQIRDVRTRQQQHQNGYGRQGFQRIQKLLVADKEGVTGRGHEPALILRKPMSLDGALSGTTPPWNLVDIYNSSPLNVYFDGLASPNISFAGVAPGYAAGLYPINAQIPAGVSNGDDYLDILTRTRKPSR